MTAIAIDWASKPPPWNEIGPQFRREVEAIIADRPMPMPPPPPLLKAKPATKMRRHRPAVLSNAAHQAAVLKRNEEIAAAKAVLAERHAARSVGVKRLSRREYSRAGIFDDEEKDEAAAAIIAASRA